HEPFRADDSCGVEEHGIRQLLDPVGDPERGRQDVGGPVELRFAHERLVLLARSVAGEDEVEPAALAAESRPQRREKLLAYGAGGREEEEERRTAIGAWRADVACGSREGL